MGFAFLFETAYLLPLTTVLLCTSAPFADGVREGLQGHRVHVRPGRGGVL